MHTVRTSLLNLSFILLSLSGLHAQAWSVFGPGSAGTFHIIDTTSYLVLDYFRSDIFRYKNGFKSKVYDAGPANIIEDFTSTPNGTLYAVVDLFQITSGRVLKSNDKGNTWQETLVPWMTTPFHIYFYSDSLGFITATDASIWRTENAGTTWKKVSGGSYVSYHDMHFLNALEGYTVGGRFHLTSAKRTFDGGQTWQGWSGCAGQNCNSLSFGSPCTAYATSSTAFSKWDRETNIIEELQAPEGSGYSTVYFLNDMIGFLAVDTNVVGQPYFNDESLLYMTTDGGASWILQDAPYPVARPTEIQRLGNKLYMNCGNLSDETEERILVMTIPSYTTFILNDAVIHPQCHGFPNGEIMLMPTNAVSPIDYSWSVPGYTGNHVTGLAPGTYTVFATDASGLCASQSFILHATTSLDATLNVTNEVQFNLNGKISVNAIEGIAPYTYSWSHSDTLHDSIATRLSAGSYSVTVIDANGCETIHTAEVKRVSQLAGKVEFTIATNPFQGTITIRSIENQPADSHYRLFNVNGQLIQTGNVNARLDTEITSDVTRAGIYFLQIIGKKINPQVFTVWLAPS